MNCRIIGNTSSKDIAELFTSVFTLAEGKQEGRAVGKLSSELVAGIDNENIICFGAYEERSLIGSIFFTRLWFRQPILVYMLAPVAVHTEYQGRGIGQMLISYGLNELKKRAVSIAITYGDPSFYSKVGFHALSEEVIQAPLKLSMPHGWLGQSLSDEEIPVIAGRPSCVAAFDVPAYW
ncbi:MAG: N-acetyltransferase [Gammaproteobacteria bacterium]|nr:N-acetyltransferase [Gammaproteobacteria bacterium]